MSIKTIINKIVLASLVLMATMISASANVTEEQKKLFGVWQLKPTSTAQTYQQIKPEFFALPIEFAPESLILAADETGTEITINEGFKTYINTQTLPINGTVVTKNINQIGKVFTKAFWLKNKFVVNTTTESGLKVTELFELSPNKTQLFVTVQTNKKGNQKTRRIYTRVAEKVEDKTARVGIATYPF